jgi:hypothetical protein
MAHWAEVNSDNKVIRVLVTSNEGDEGYDFLVTNLGGRWIKTSYNTIGGKHRLGGTPLRKNFAGVGYTYDEQRDAFIDEQPFVSWVLNEETCIWEAPTPYPTDGKNYGWDEQTLSWVEAEAPTEE